MIQSHSPYHVKAIGVPNLGIDEPLYLQFKAIDTNFNRLDRLSQFIWQGELARSIPTA